VTSDTEHQHSDDSDGAEEERDDEEEESDEDESDTEEGEEAKSSPSEVVPQEHRTKEKNDLSAGARDDSASSHGAKRLRAEAFDSAEKQPKELKQVSAKPRKAAVPRIKVAVPLAST
jgi:hypothetical protein